MSETDTPSRDDALTDVEADASTSALRRRSAKAEGQALVTVSLDLSERVIDFFKIEGGDWQARVNDALNLLVNRQNARDAKKRARLRARSAVRRRTVAG
ncbi:hypothetical protein K32_37680 [Kaistia sp. 32K]|uniref:BrnA antitoxin family protein n=1 Tax=Kaistia sp. 32K TaxID=2795690 RepID=UPI0019152279|nr:BrnA antitoxin family protein [Kaistia sp. 32K]BCP55151.1 hypothetical protein K32_37680 [Kaistia sp. 32K]